jgi:hypothetical protein
MSVQKFNRKDLYNMVWATPLRLLAQKYRISDVGLRKMCKRMMIPVPNNGHWARLPINRVAPLKLSARYSGDDEVRLELRTKKDDSDKEALKELTEEFKANHVVRIYEKLTDPDELVIASQKILHGKEGRSYRQEGMMTCSRNGLNICVLPENVDRALCFMDAVIKALEKRGHNIRLRHSQTFAVIFDVEIEISFRDKLKREPDNTRSYPSTRLVPTGLVCFRSRVHYNDKEWKDGTQTIEQQLPAIMAKLELEGGRIADERIWRDKQDAIRERKEKKIAAIKARKEKELAEFKNMLGQSVRWKKANDLRDYIDAREKHALENNQHDEKFIRWLEWARKKADWYDPFINSKEMLLKDIELDDPILEKTKPAFEKSYLFETKNFFQKSFYQKR